MNQSVDPSLSIAAWSSRIASFAELEDERLDARLAQVLQALAAKPLDSFPQACGAKWADTKALYRFLDNERVCPSRLLAPIVSATVMACRGQSVILAVQDTTSLNFSKLKATKGLGPLNDSPTAQGLHLHSTLALRLDGLPLGLLDQQCWARDPQERTAASRHERALEEKESHKWLAGVVAARTAFATLPASVPAPRLIHVMDREGDIHLVMQAISATTDGAVIRCAHDRRVEGSISSAPKAVRAAPLLGSGELAVPRRAQQPARTATVEYRACRVTIAPKTPRRGRDPIEWTLLEVYEPNPPAGVEPLLWRLWTTEPVTTLAEALEIARIYSLRWEIEEFHLTLKSGCRVEQLELETARRLQNAITLYSSVAVRILTIRDQARQQPDAPCAEILTEDEWRVLWQQTKNEPAAPDQRPPTIREAVLWIGRLGGHLNRKSDGMPGVRTLWRGLRDLAILVAGYRCGRNSR